jgi:methyltransferase (TIGR00027 family)
MDANSQASKTALMVAGYRALASARENPVCRDPWAAGLAGEEGVALAEKFSTTFRHMELWIAVRTGFIDEVLRHCVETEGAKQVVILGAGLDSRAARLARPGLRYFEVDHPATQEDKRARLASLPAYPIEASTFAGCDFESDGDPIAALVEAGLDPSSPALVIWEGVTPYLSETAIRATTSQIASGLHERSTLIFDYVNKKLVQDGDLPAADQEAKNQIRDMGEPMRWGTNNPLPLLFESGFHHVRTISFEEACLSLTQSYERERAFRFQSMAVASCATWPRF